MGTNPQEQSGVDLHEQTGAGSSQHTATAPRLFVCHGDEGGPRVHPCRRVQEALRAAGIAYEKTIAAHGSPIPFLRKGSREELARETGTTKLPVLKLADGTVIAGSRAIIAWVGEQP
jgi:hypothetical protein